MTGDLQDDDRYLDLVLEETVGQLRPPDLRARVLGAGAAQRDAVLHRLGRARARRARLLMAAVVVLAVSVTLGVLAMRGNTSAEPAPISNTRDGAPDRQLLIKSLAEFQRYLPEVEKVSIAVLFTRQHNVHLDGDKVQRRWLPAEVVGRLRTQLGRGLRATAPAGWIWPNEIRLHLKDGRYLSCSMYLLGAARLGIRSCGDFTMSQALVDLLAPEIAAQDLRERLRQGAVFGRADLERRGAVSVPDTVTSLRCYGLVDEDLTLLERFTALRELDLAGCRKSLRGVGLAHLEKVPTLTTLRFRYAEIDDDGLAALATHPGLRELVLSNSTGITGQGFGAFATRSRLERLDISWSRSLTDAGMRTVAGIGTLRVLDASGRKLGVVTKAGLAALGGAKALQSLDLDSSQLSMDEVLASLGALADLRELDVSFTNVSAVGVTALQSRHYADHHRPVTPLRKLRLRGCKEIKGKGLAAVARFTDLEDLELSGTGLRSSLLAPTGEREGLTDFNAIGRMQRLRRLVMNGVELAAPDCRFFSVLWDRLQVLDLSFAGDGIDDAALRWLGRTRSLVELRLAGCDAFTDVGLAELGGLKQLRKLDLNTCDGFTAEGVAALRAALPELELVLPQRLR